MRISTMFGLLPWKTIARYLGGVKLIVKGTLPSESSLTVSTRTKAHRCPAGSLLHFIYAVKRHRHFYRTSVSIFVFSTRAQRDRSLTIAARRVPEPELVD